jgi:hypothetical protein
MHNAVMRPTLATVPAATCPSSHSDLKCHETVFCDLIHGRPGTTALAWLLRELQFDTAITEYMCCLENRLQEATCQDYAESFNEL